MRAPLRSMASLALAAFLALAATVPAHAAPGDLVFRIGVDYHFDMPTGVAADDAGRAYVVDGRQPEVFVFDPAGNLERTFPATDAYNAGVSDVDVDAHGNVYTLVPYGPGGIVRVFDNAGNLLRAFGSAGYPAADGVIVYPTAVGADPLTGYVYVTDGYSNVVQVFDDSGAFVRQWGGYGYGPYNFMGPNGVAVGMDGRVYVSDERGRAVKVFDGAGVFLYAIGSYGAPMDVAVDRANGEVHVAESGFPAGVRVYDASGALVRSYGEEANYYQGRVGIGVGGGGNAYVTSATYERGGVMAFDAAGSYVRLLAAFGSEEGRFDEPGHLAVDGQGRIYVADTENHRVQVFDPNGVFLRAWGSYGTGPGELSYPTGIAVKGDGNVYVSERARIHIFTQEGEFLRSWGRIGLGEDDLNVVVAVDVDRDGNVYAADAGSHRIVVFDASGNFVAGWRLWDKGPFDVVVDESGLVHALTWEGWYTWSDIQIFDRTGAFMGKWYSVGYGIRAFALDGCGNTYLTGDQGKVRVLGADQALLAEWGVSGYEPGQFLMPWGIEAPGDGRVYVSELGNHRVQVLEGFGGCGAVLADAGPDQTVEQTGPEGAAVALDGSASAGPCGDGLAHEWSWEGGTATGVAPVVLLPAGTTTVTLTVACGSSQAQDSVSVTVRDTLPPVTTATVTGTPGTNGWYVSDVTVALAASDSGSGVGEVSYSLNGEPGVAVPGAATSVVLAEDGTFDLSYHATDLAGNVEAARTLSLKADTAPPEVAITGVQDGASYVVGSAPVPGYAVSDALSGVASEEAVLGGGNEGGLGTFTYTVTATDNAGNTRTASATYRVVYAFSDFIGNLADHKPFKHGSTVPVKFRLADGSGNCISTAVATISLQMYSNEEPVGEPIEATSTSGADTGNTFRYVAADDLYIYNLSTDPLGVGTWLITVALDDGTTKSILVGIK